LQWLNEGVAPPRVLGLPVPTKLTEKSVYCYNIVMNNAVIPTKTLAFLLEDTASRNQALGRRMTLLSILLAERCLDREQLVVRVEALLGKGCCGTAWQNVFYREIRLV
jgi:hypothetical protein